MVSLNKPTEGDTDWATPVNDNFTTLESSLALAGLCQGRLTLDMSDSVMTSNTTSSTLYFLPHAGNVVGLFNTDSTKMTWEAHEIPSGSVEVSLSGKTKGTVVDVFLYDDAGTLKLDLADWTSGNRTTLGSRDEVAVMFSDHSRLYVGTIMIDASNDNQCVWDEQNRLVWNMYNRLPVFMRETASTSWNLTTSGAWVAWPSSVGSWTFRFVVGLIEDSVFAHANATPQYAASFTAAYIGITLNPTPPTPVARATDCIGGAGTVSNSGAWSSISASWTGFGALGSNSLIPINRLDGAIAVTFNGYVIPTHGPAGFVVRLLA